MSRDSWKSVTSHKGCEWSTWLHECTLESWALLNGIVRFFTTDLPEILREVLGHLHELAISSCRIGYHLGKFLGVTAAWLAVLFLPIILYPGWITVAWMVLAICASVWGYRRHKQRRAFASRKEGWHASA